MEQETTEAFMPTVDARIACPICTFRVDRRFPYEKDDEPHMLRLIDDMVERHLRDEHGLISLPTHEQELFEECRKASDRATAEVKASAEYRLGAALAELTKDRSLDWITGG